MTHGEIPRRVLMVHKFLYPRGGAELYMFRLVELLRRRGIESLYFASRHGENWPAATERFFPSEIDFGRPAPGLARVRAAGRAVYSLEARRGMSQLLSEERDIDVAHLHNIYHHLSPSVLAPIRQHGIPVVMTVHDFKLVCPVKHLNSHGEICERCVGGHFSNALRFKCNRGSLTGSALVAGETWLHWRLGLYSRGIDVFLAPSRFARDKLVATGYSAERVRIAPNYVDPKELTPSYGGDSYFVYLGRLSHEKGVDVLLEAAREGRFSLKIAGEGPARGELEAAAKRLRVRADFLGHLSFEPLTALVAQARGVVIPSRCHENCPLAALEAMAWGKPVVASRTGGMPELVEQGEHGLLVDPGNPAELNRALERLTEAPEEAERMGRSGRKRVERFYTPEAHFEAVSSAYALAGSMRNGVGAS